MPFELANNHLNGAKEAQEAATVSDTPRRDAALYIAEMILELRNVAKAAQLKTLQGYLELTYYEAYTEANKVVVPAGELEHLHMIGNDARRAMAESGP